MEKPPYFLISRKGKNRQGRSHPLGLIGFLAAALLSIVGAAGVILGVNRYAEVTQDLPAPENLQALLDPASGLLLTPTRIVDRTGQNELWRFENPLISSRRYVSLTDGEMFFYSEVPEPLILATIAALDPDYLSRPDSFLPCLLDSSPDPLPESLVGELLLWQETSHPDQDTRLNLLSCQVVARYGRKKVLEWYLNSAYYGKEIFGAAQAAQFYFGKDLQELDLSESAMLAAVGAYPALNPLDAALAAQENQAEILGKMADAGLITSNQAVSAARKQLVYADPDLAAGTVQPAYIDLILTEASQTIPPERLLRGGFLIVSTLDSRYQGQLECTLDFMLERVQGGQPQLDPACEAARLLPKYDGPQLTAGDLLEVDLAVLDPVNGELLALAGQSTEDQPLTVDQPRLPGSLVTPFIYLNSFTQGFEPASLVWDIPLPESELDSDTLHPGCQGECQFRGPVNIRTALVNDLLAPARQLLDKQGTGQLRGTLGLFGFSLQGTSCPGCPVFPEGSTLDMVDILQGYGVFANGGVLTGRPSETSSLEFQPAAVSRIEDAAGAIFPMSAPHQERKIISEELAYLITHTLSDQEAWLDPQAREFFSIGKPAGVKVGYVPGDSSGWTVGFTPDLVVGAWAGLSGDDDGIDLDPTGISSSLWRAVTQYAAREETDRGWEVPPGIITRDVCYPSGQLPTENCPRVVREVFIEGYEPLVADTLYKALEVNKETGQLASVFTPSERIEERVFLNIPPQAQAWAEEAGIAAPPTLYDLEAPDPESGGLALLTPENLSFVRGRVPITGRIPEEDFLSARLQYGAGINPRSWLQIGNEIGSAVDDGYLGSWDTSDLDEGIYALQLVLIKEDQEIQKTSLLVSVDNTPPEIILITDLSGGEVPYRAGKDLLLEVQFNNNSEIDQVDFRLDDQLLASRRVAPFLTPWPLALGEHKLLVTARDQAGNQDELEVDFSVVRE